MRSWDHIKKLIPRESGGPGQVTVRWPWTHAFAGESGFGSLRAYDATRVRAAAQSDCGTASLTSTRKLPSMMSWVRLATMSLTSPGSFLSQSWSGAR